LLALFAFAGISSAGNLITSLAWQASPSPEAVGYAVYYQVANLPLTNRVDVGKALSVTIPLLIGVVHSIYVVAYTADGVESEPSNLLNYTPPPITPVKLTRQPDGAVQLRFRTSPLSLCWIEWTPTLEHPVWQALAMFVADANGNVVVSDPGATESAARFYRAAKF
jgi:hypothetical protein